MEQKRRFERIRPQGRVASVAKIFIGPKIPVIECLLVDYSAGGACIQLQKHVDLPARFELLYGTTRKRCRAVWKRGLRIGLGFLTCTGRGSIGAGAITCAMVRANLIRPSEMSFESTSVRRPMML
jgi:hypothetical protein